MQTDKDLIEQARDLFESGDFEGAEKAYRNLIGRVDEGKRVNLELMIGACQQAQGRNSEAVETMQRAVDLDDSHVGAWFQLGCVRRQGGDEKGSIEALDKALELNPNHALARVELGHLAQAAGDGERAEAHFRTALRADPECVPALAGLAERLLGTGQVERAYELSVRAIQLQPDNIGAQVVMARVFLQRGHPDFAERCLDNALSAAPNNAALHRAMAQLLLERGRSNESLAAAAEARRCGDSDHDLDLLEVHALRQLGYLAEARRRLEEFIRDQQLDATHLLMLAELRLADGDAAAASELIDQLDRDWPQAAQLIRAQLAEREGDRAYAAELAAGLHGDSNARLRRQSRVLSARLALADNDLQECIEALRPLAAEGDDDPFLHWILARALDQAGLHEEAGKHLQRTGWRAPTLMQAAGSGLSEDAYKALETLDVDGWPTQAPEDGRPKPVFILGWPGSGRDQLLIALAEHESIRMLDHEGAAQRREVLGFSARPKELAALDEGKLRLARKRYLRRAGHSADHVLEPMWLPMAALPAIARFFPGSTVVLTDAELRDLELEWRLAGFSGVETMRALWQREQAVLEKMLETLPLDFMVFSRGDLENDAAAVAAQLAEKLGLDDSARLAGAIERSLASLRPTGHWKHYEQLFEGRSVA